MQSDGLFNIRYRILPPEFVTTARPGEICSLAGRMPAYEDAFELSAIEAMPTKIIVIRHLVASDFFFR